MGSKRVAGTGSQQQKPTKKAKLPPLPQSQDSSESEEDIDEEDSEPNEWDEEDSQDGEEDDEGDEDDDMIGDDDQDLIAGLSEDGREDDQAEDSEDEAGNEEGDAPTATAIKPLKKANVRRSAAPKSLTTAELRALAFAELTASPLSTFLSTSTTSLLSSLTPPPPITPSLKLLLKSLHSLIVGFGDQDPTTVDDLVRKMGLKGLELEGSGTKWTNEMKFGWTAPTNEGVMVGGNWAWGGGIKLNREYFIDLLITIPESQLQAKDYLSPRFQTKSTHYLLTLSSLLLSSSSSTVLNRILSSTAHTLSLTPLPNSQGFSLDIRPTSTSSKSRPILRLKIVWPENYFPSLKISPLSSLVKPSTSPTPYHSSSLNLSSLAVQKTHLKHLYAVSVQNPSLGSASRLLQIWGSKRGYEFGEDWWRWCVSRNLNWGGGGEAGGSAEGDGGKSWALWRKTVEWLAGVNWKEGVWFRVEGGGGYPKDDFKNAWNGKPVYGDCTGSVNLASGISAEKLEMLKHDAKTTIELLLSNNVSDEIKFDGVFLKEIRVAEKFDGFARIVVSSSSITKFVSTDSDNSSKLEAFTSDLSSTISRALGSRCRSFQLISPSLPSIPLSSPPPSLPTNLIFTLGILLDPAQANRIVDQGPSAEDEEACQDFRSFWGSMSELRRFKDGAILESVVWEDSETGAKSLGPQRNKIVGKILKHILEHRFKISDENIEVNLGGMDGLIVEPEGVRKAIFVEDAVTTGKGFGLLMGVYDDLSKELTGLKNLPLEISSIKPYSAGLRYSTIFTPSSRRLKEFGRQPLSMKWVEVHDILITLEGSGRWPDDLEGVQKIKAAFLARIGEELGKSHTIVETNLKFDLEAEGIDDNVSLEILTSSGFAFSARIFYERSLILLRERKSHIGGSVGGKAIEVFKERFVTGPKHHAAISTLQHHFTSYSPTIRLVKRWFSTHMLLSKFPEQLLELLVANVFLDPTSIYDPPQSGTAGFARVMGLLSSWRWRDSALFVPLYTFSTSTTSGRRAIIPSKEKSISIKSFEDQRRKDPQIGGFAWIVATEEDPTGTTWGWKTEKVAAGRVRELAKATLKTLESGLIAGRFEVEQLFQPPMGDYAFLLHLDSSAIPRHFHALSPDSKALSRKSVSPDIVAGSSARGLHDNNDVVRLGWDPVGEFVKRVEALYPSVLVLFHAEGAAVIGGIWNPSAEGPRQWKVGLGFPCEPVVTPGEEGSQKTKVQLDKKAVLGEIARLGRGLVVKVQVM